MEYGAQPSACVGAGVDNLCSGQRCSTDDRPGNAAKLADSQLARAPGAAALVGGDGAGVVVEVAENGEVKRKRGRPPRSQGKVGVAAGPTAKKSKKDEEDVCFICFDGGKLVLCDRRDCPKAYHPACVKRDESFFRRRVRWNCGWHLCNVCQKNALFMCYTCPYSLCKGCVKQADVLSVRGNQGFCRTCMTTIMLIENVTEGNKEMAQVDFDDKSSWEYLFKVYWIYLKQKESLTVDELTRATNPWRGLGLDQKMESLPKMHNMYAGKTSVMSCTIGQLEANASKRRKTRKQPNMQDQDSQLVEKVIDPVVSCSRDNADWASKDLLEFVIHMKNGDTSMLSQFDVQALLLEYIRKNNLRDPRRKCQIICDRRLENLFGKARVGHFEMLKLLEYHFKEESRASNVIQGAADSMAGQKEAVGISEDAETMSRDKKRQTSKKGHEKGQTDLDNFAAIDIHNIGLIYLKRNLMENLIQDAEKFHDKVVGSVVRIRIPGNDQKPDMYRLVRVVGTSKAAEAYTPGNKTSNVMLKILNLNKTEDVAIDGISNQEFTEDECGRLCQSIECGFAQRMTVGEIQEKAIALQTVRVNDSLEAEILRLNHLRDRASEMGHRKELREFVEKLELLNTPAELERRLQEIPEVHADPRMDPGHESDDDYGQSDVTKQDLNLTPNNSNSSAKAVEFIALKRAGKLPNSSGSKALNMTPNSDRKRKSARLQSGKDEGAMKDSERPHQYSQKPEKANAASRVLDELRDRVDPIIQGSSHAAVISGSFSGAAAVTSSPSVLTGLACVSGNGDFDKVWHYQDPSGRVQGPFFMLQLRKWSSSGYFPTDLRVWRINEKQDQSILLTEALTREPQFQHNNLSKFQVAEIKPDNITAESLGNLSSNHDSAVTGHTRSNEAGSIGLTSAVSGRATNGRRGCKKSGKSQRYLPAQRTLVCGLPCLPSAVCPRTFKKSTFKKSTLKFKIKPSGLTLPSEIASENPKDPSVDKESALNVPQKSSLPCYNASSSCIEFSDSQSGSLKSKLHNVDLNVQAMESKDSGGLNVAGHELATKPSCASINVEFSDLPSPTSKSEPENVGLNLCSGESEDNGALNVPECNLGSKSSSASENMESSGLGTKQRFATGDVETSGVPNHTAESETDNMDMNLLGSASKDSATPNAPEHDADVLTKLEPGNTDMSLQVSGSIDCGASDVLESEVGTKPSHTASKSEPDNVEMRVQGRKSGTSDAPEINLGAEKSSFSSDVEFCDLPITKPKSDDDAPAVESADVQQSVESNSHGQDSGIQWGNCSGVEINDMPRSAQKASNDGLKDCVVEIKQPVSSNIPGQSSGVSWSTASSLVGEVHLPEVAGEWNQCSEVETKPSVEELGSDIVSSCLSKLTEAVSNYATPPHSCQFSHSSPSHPECSTSRWHAMEPIELSTLGDESVSDLLSEVEALESLKLLASPSSRMNPETDQIGSPKSDCFSMLVGLSPRFDPGKHVHDTLNSTCEMQFHSPPTSGDESHREFQVHVHNNVRASDAQSTPSPEIEAELDKAFASIQENELKPAVIPMRQGISSPLESSLSQLPVSTVTLDSSSVGLECSAKPAYALMHQGNNIISHAHHLAQLQPSCTGMDCPLSSRVEEELKPAFSGVLSHGLISQAHQSTASTAATGGLVSSFGIGPVRELKPAVIPMHQQISVSRSSPTVLSPASPRVCASASHGEVGEVKPLISVHGKVLEAQPAAALPLASRSPQKKEEVDSAFSMHEEALVSEIHSTARTVSSPPPAMNLDAPISPQGGERFISASVSVHEDAVVSEAHPPTPPSLPAAPPPVHLDPSRSVGEEGTVMPPSVSMQQAGSVSKVHRPATPPTSTSPQSYTSAPEEGEVVPPPVSAQQSSPNTAEEGEVVPPPVSTRQPELISQSHLPVAETKSRDVTATLAPGRAGLLPTPQTTTQDATAPVSPGRPRLERLDTGRGTYREDTHASWNGSAMQNTYIAGRDSQGINSGNTNVHRANHVANQGTIASHQQSRHRSAGRHSGPKDRNYQGIVDSGFGRGRPSWGRQPSFGSGGSSRQPPHRGQRVCKFYEGGYCKRGASCSYLHPSKQ